MYIHNFEREVSLAWKLNNTFLYNPLGKKEVSKEVKVTHGTEGKNYITYQNV